MVNTCCAGGPKSETVALTEPGIWGMSVKTLTAAVALSVAALAYVVPCQAQESQESEATSECTLWVKSHDSPRFDAYYEGNGDWNIVGTADQRFHFMKCLNDKGIVTHNLTHIAPD